ncbi:DUF7151 family protein [Ferruginibacter sp. SUN106]|uniref:DUF7151 family protein n=1 Tax=Ferruginibacter sp. SUN106 TaxID=2978348 RepID=UPI003D35E4EA
MKSLFSFIIVIAFVNTIKAQVPNQFNYQAVARNSLGESIGNANIRLRLTILDGSASGVNVYSEVRQVITNQLGIFTAAIGGPGAVSTTGNFATINWSTGKKFIKVEADPLGGNNFSILGNTEMLSVPYALYAVNGKVGPAGPANILNIGTVTTGTPGSAANVTITGTSPSQTLNLTIPTGAAGPTGATGPQGPIGLTGATGPQGIQGVAGPIGATGPAGAIGPAGPQGIPGKNTLIKTTAEPSGPNCADGGVKQEYGIDADGNGILDPAEINATLTQYVCNGTAGAATGFWDLNGTAIFNNNTGNVGIGTNNPGSKLTIETGYNTNGWMHIGRNGTDSIVARETIGGVSAAIGTATEHILRLTAGALGRIQVIPTGEVIIGDNFVSPFGRLTVQTTNNAYGISHLGEGGNILATRMGGSSAGIGTFSATNMRIFSGGFSRILVAEATGNVGIGTDNPTYKLSVVGNIRAYELVVENNWADYVFDKKYKLLPLTEVEKFIQQNKHLPNIPSAKDVEEKGLHVGDIQKRMMEKIEELTLYIIQQQKEIDALKKNAGTDH